MAQNLCTPQNTFGGFDQTLFCGASVLSFSATGGWNSQQGECTVILVEDDCSGGTRVYWDHFLIRRTTTAADPGFTRPSIGAPAMFRIAEFEFTGIIQSWKEINSTNGKPTFEIKLVDPREILEGTQIITAEYAGSVNPVYNIINVFGYMESFGVFCPAVTINGAVFGTPAGGYGGAGVNVNGMAWNRVKDAISVLTAAFPLQSNQWSPHGRLLFKGCEPTKHGYGVMGADRFDPTIISSFTNHHGYLAEFLIDISEVPSAPDFWRIPGPSLNLLDLITQVCSTAGCDYYIELIPVKMGSFIQKIIKVRTVSRNTQPLLGEISSFISSVTEGVVDDAIGRELRNEDTTSFLVGDNIQSVYQAFNGTDSGVLEPFWGLDSDGDVIVSTIVNGEHVVPVSFVGLNNELFNSMPTTTGEVTENELRHALSGYDQWLAYILGADTDFGNKIASRTGSSHLYDMVNVAKILEFITNLGNALTPRQLLNLSQFVTSSDVEQKDLDIIYQFVAKYAREYYGRQFQVHLPFTCAYLDPESLGYFTSEEPASDGGWTESTTVIGLTHPSLTVPFETDNFGKLGTYLRFPQGTGAEYPNTNETDFVFFNSNLFVKAEIEEEFVYTDRSTFTGPRAVVTIDNAIQIKQENTNDLPRIAQALEILSNINNDADETAKLKDILKNVGSQNMLFEVEAIPAFPDAAAVPLRSNIATYGPWFVRGPAGRARMSQDIGLVPWEFGSISNMNAGGLARVSDAVTLQQVVEHGNITVAGYPDIPLGAEIGAKAGGFFGAGKHLVENRNITTQTFTATFATGGTANITYRQFTYGQWTGLFGPNVTNISVNVGAQGIQTTYTMRTFTPQFGRFAKANAERFGEIGRQRLDRLKGRKVNRNLQARTNALIRRLQERDRINNVVQKDGRKRSSPVDVFVGQQMRWPKVLTNDDELFRNNIVEAIPMHEMVGELENYNKKAMMSLDGLIRPISKSGDAGLPQYISLSGTQCADLPHTSEQPQPPINKNNQYTPAIVNTSYLDPFSNDGAIQHHAGNAAGHDIDILARGANVPASSLSIPVDEFGGGGYAADYRLFGLRGPIMMTAWGYDLDGKPVPNAADTEIAASGGEFRIVGLQDNFMTDWLRKSHTWPVAPVDLRLDRKRGVWTIPQSPRILRATIDTNISQGSSGNASPSNLPTVYDAAGNAVAASNSKIVVSAADFGLSAGNKIYAYYDSEDCVYYPITTGGGGGGGNSLISSLGCDCPLVFENNISGRAISHFIFSTGLTVVSGSCRSGLGGIFNKTTTFSILGGIEVDSTQATVNISSFPPRTSKITFGEGLSTEDLGDCEMLLTSIPELRITDVNCECVPGSITDLPVSHLTFSTGLNLVAGSCTGEGLAQTFSVTAGIKLTDGESCFMLGVPATDQVADSIVLHGGLAATYDDTPGAGCKYRMETRIFATGIECPIEDHPIAGSGFNELHFGEGIKTSQIDACIMAINTNLTISDDDFVATQVHDITLGCGLSGTDGSCTTTLSVNPLSKSGIVQEMKLVEDVECTGNIITVTYVTLRFSECGLFLESGTF